MRNRDTEVQPSHTSTQPETVVGASLKIEGDLKSNGDIRIDGEVTGSVETKGDVFIGPEAAVNANVMATNAHVAGRVTGDIVVNKKLSLESSARVKGNVTSAELVVSQGARFNGTSSMTGEEADQVTAKAKLARPEVVVSA